jgi:L-iditol 2-dehydrogenase
MKSSLKSVTQAFVARILISSMAEWPCRPPVVLGHEFCGTAVEVGSLVKGFRPGDRIVASNPAQTCGTCPHCRAGNPFMCGKRVSAGYMIDGAFADYLCIRAERCHHLPDHVSFRQASLGEPLSVAVHAVMERMTVHAGDLVFISVQAVSVYYPCWLPRWKVPE